MERSESPPPERKALAGLDRAVGRALDRIEVLESRLREAEVRRGELQALLGRFETGEESPEAMMERLRRLERENEECRRRMEEGRAAVDRLLARIRFLEEQA